MRNIRDSKTRFLHMLRGSEWASENFVLYEICHPERSGCLASRSSRAVEESAPSEAEGTPVSFSAASISSGTTDGSGKTSYSDNTRWTYRGPSTPHIDSLRQSVRCAQQDRWPATAG